MAADPFDTLRLALMQDVLPVGLAVVDRVRKGGPQQVLEAFDGSSPDPIDQLRQEGETAATQVREQLDRVTPGLGNPVMKVEVRDVDPVVSQAGHGAASAELQERLMAISDRLTLLEQRLTPLPQNG